MATASNHSSPGLDDEGPLPLSSIILGGGVFGSQYNPSEYLESDVPAQVIRLAFEHGINAIDTSPFYGTSESIIGSALASKDGSTRIPRESYHLITKCGRYGANRWSFDYSPQRIRQSVQTSLERFQTDYIDVVYLHDVEFVADSVGKANEAGYPAEALQEANLASFGLDPECEGRIVGDGDVKILNAYKTLLELKDEGKIRRAGIAGYPLPTLLRLARLIKRLLAPVDILQTYSHYNLQNTALADYMPYFLAAGVVQVTNGATLQMGLLTETGPQFWHLAPKSLRQACQAAHETLRNSKPPTSLQAVALRFGLKSLSAFGAYNVIGCTTLDHVVDTLHAWQSARDERAVASQDTQRSHENAVMAVLEETGYYNWSWASPPPFTEAERS